MPGAPGVPDTSSTPGGLYQPSAGDAVAALFVAGVAAAQLFGTDIVPTKVARPTPADTAEPPPRLGDPSAPIAEPTLLNPAAPVVAADAVVLPVNKAGFMPPTL